MSKISEKCMNAKLMLPADNLFDLMLSAYRKGQGCNTLLLNMVSE